MENIVQVHLFYFICFFDNLSKKPKASSVGRKKIIKQKYKRLKTKQKERPIFTLKGSNKLVQERRLFQNLRVAWCISICAYVTKTKVADYRYSKLAFVATSSGNNKELCKINIPMKFDVNSTVYSLINSTSACVMR